MVAVGYIFGAHPFFILHRFFVSVTKPGLLQSFLKSFNFFVK
jgi:hypothetical protein